MSAPTSATSELPSRSLTNRSVDEDAIPGEDTSEVRSAEFRRQSNALTYYAGDEVIRRAVASLETCRCIPRRLRYGDREDKPRTWQGV